MKRITSILIIALFLTGCGGSQDKGTGQEERTGSEVPLKGEEYDVDSLPPDDTHIPIDGTETRDTL